MHVLGHSFSNRRKSKPRDLHIRKVSFSGCSLSGSSTFSGSSISGSSTFSGSSISGSSVSSGGSSFSSVSSPRNPSTATTASFDPLQLHPPFQPPPRLYDRPLHDEARRPSGGSFDDDENGDEEDSDCEKNQVVDDEQQLPEQEDYFFMHLVKQRQRPTLPRSRWSESTIQTLDEPTPVMSNSDDTTPVAIADFDDEEVDPLEVVPNFNYKRDTAPKRPSIKPMDSFDDWIKRGGWKRRGIVFQTEDMERFDETM